MQRHAIVLAIVLEALQIGVAIRVVMEDRRAAIPAGQDMIEPDREIESWLAGHGRSVAGGVVIRQYACLTTNCLIRFGMVSNNTPFTIHRTYERHSLHRCDDHFDIRQL
jgi:hypothetical protein